ncbi:cbb3-type cytochrome oxidase assembly protein CcoS [Vibrio profundum]|uniref:cbb3-type cytochrome oxidase assembly protein CcoS n=1 Tax=Vibrio profundum TaxID=2910247 RepID=UPI003D09B3F9
MASLYILIPIAIVLVCIAGGIFIWAVKHDQFEDLDRQGLDILMEDEENTSEKAKKDEQE